jgi:thymidylate synthase
MHFNIEDQKELINSIRKSLLDHGVEVKTQKWQGKEIDLSFIELLGVSIETQMENDIEVLVKKVNPNLPWADIHFDERTGGEPLNPPPSHIQWNIKTDEYLMDSKFSHSYPERMWSKGLHSGIRFDIADLSTLIDVLKKEPDTRQAYLPIFFPEDLSASLIGERIPCTLGWHFIIRDEKLHCHYPMRSCDAVRHMHNDIYFANRLGLWILDQCNFSDISMGKLYMNITSLHAFKNDSYTLKQMTK